VNWRPFFRRAEHLLLHRDELLAVLGDALAKAYARRKVLYKVFADLMLLFRFVRAWARGDYREMPRKSVLWAMFAIIYFLSPIDLIPDFLPGGYIDDMFVIAYVVKKIRADLDRFEEFERKRKAGGAGASGGEA
jgi:uncharacterized membrane protein YkvA (DUF1232 family)